MTPRSYPLGDAFPREAFVQAAIERYFRASGYAVDVNGHADLVCAHADRGDSWLIEAKGETSDVGLDFRGGLGQLLTRMRDPATRYGLAMPDTPKFARMRGEVTGRVRAALGLHWLIVNAKGEVRVEGPPPTG